jgi:hypothetical protein
MTGGRYLWHGRVLYVARAGGRWAAAYDGPCGEPSYAGVAELRPCATKDEMQSKLDFWAGLNGLEPWRG